MEQGNDQILVLRDNAKMQLMQIKTVEDGISYMNKLKAIDVWVKAEKKDAELQNIVAEQKIRTQRILGELISEGQEQGTIAGQGDRTNSNVPERNISTLDDIGITRKQSSAFQQIASIPEDDFEDFILEKKAAVNNAVAELTTTGAVRLAKSLQEKKTELAVNQSLSERLLIEKGLKELAHDINMKYTKDQRIFLVSQIKQ